MYWAVHVHHFLYLRYCQAVDIFQNFCWPIAIWAVSHFWSISATAKKQFGLRQIVLHIRQRFFIFNQLSLFLTTGQNMLTNCNFGVNHFFELLQFEQLYHPHWKVLLPIQTVNFNRAPIKQLICLSLFIVIS